MRCSGLWFLLAFLPLLITNGCLSTSTNPSGGKFNNIRHVVVIFQENRTPDNLFHGLPNADIASAGFNSQGQVIPLAAVPLSDNYDLDHSHTAFLKMYDNGQMDGADLLNVGCKRPVRNCIPPNPQFAYVNPADVAPYFDLAEQYVFADRMFQTNQGPSFPAHQFIISGTSAPTASSDLFVAENPPIPFDSHGVTGCSAPEDERVLLIDPSGNESINIFPCFEHPAISDLLDQKKLSWRYYTPSAGTIWTGPNAIRHLRFGPDWKKDVVIPQTQVLSDIATGHLATISWVIPNAKSSDHPGTEGEGPSWVASIVNAIGTSAYWSSTTILITWDDWGGWYDHVPPPIVNAYEYGFRVPLIVVSPYAKAAYVSHAMHDFGSILKFVEEVFDLGSLGYADSRADDLLDCFDFTQPPRAYHRIPTRFDARHFLNDKRAGGDPDDD